MTEPFGPFGATFERLGDVLINKVADESVGESCAGGTYGNATQASRMNISETCVSLPLAPYTTLGGQYVKQFIDRACMRRLC